jgi:hypothetical protein
MRHACTTLILAGALLAAPMAAFAATQAGQPTTKPATKPSAKSEAKASKPAAPTHTASGVVRSIDENTLVIMPAGKKTEMRFMLNSSTHREGNPAVGSSVSVRYHDEGQNHVATAINVQGAAKR